MFTVLQAIVIAAPIFYLTLGIIILARSRVICSEKPPTTVLFKVYGMTILITPLWAIKEAARGGVIELQKVDD